jgi:hypothetical protein
LRLDPPIWRGAVPFIGESPRGLRRIMSTDAASASLNASCR